MTDRKLEQQLIEEWNLKSQPETGSTFFSFAEHEWWPNDTALRKMDTSFGRVNRQDEEYWHVWCDRENGKLYVEHGRW